MMKDIKDYLKAGAPLILSGIIIDRADDIRTCLAEYGFTIIREERENDWVAIMAREKAGE